MQVLLKAESPRIVFKMSFVKTPLKKLRTMQVFQRDLRAADFLSTNEHLRLKSYTTEFLYGGQKNI